MEFHDIVKLLGVALKKKVLISLTWIGIISHSEV